MIAQGNCFTFNIIITTNYRDTYINLILTSLLYINHPLIQYF